MYPKRSPTKFTIPRFFFYLGLLTIGQTLFRPALSFTLSDWFFLMSFILTAFECLLRRKLEIRFPPLMILGLILFTVGGVISSGYADMPWASVIGLIKYLYLIAVWFWIGWTLLHTPAQILTSIALWTTSAAMSGFGAMLQLFWDELIPGTSYAWGRMAGFTEHVNDLGGLTSIALIPAIMMLTRYPKSIWRLIRSWVCAIFIAVGLLLSVSMSGIVALIASLMAWLALSKFNIKTTLILFISVLFFISAIFFQSRYEGMSFLSRLNDISDDGLHSITLQTRLDTYAAAWEVIKTNPFLGVGLGPDVSMTKTGHTVHNIFMLNWFQSGIFGLLGILIILGSIAFEAIKGLRDPTRHQERIIGVALFSSYTAFIVMGIAQPIFYNRFGWISAALLFALYTSRSRSGHPSFQPKAPVYIPRFNKKTYFGSSR